MADATSLTPRSPGLSAPLLSNKNVEPYSPKGPENEKRQHYMDVRGDFLGPPHGTTTAAVVSK